jgi:hypothetical protein
VVVPRAGELRERGGPYEIHPSGRVRNGETGRELEPYARGGASGVEYEAVELAAGGPSRQYYVHQLVGWAFVPGWDPAMQVNHRDDDPSNNHHENLRWIEAEENLDRRGQGA